MPYTRNSGHVSESSSRHHHPLPRQKPQPISRRRTPRHGPALVRSGAGSLSDNNLASLPTPLNAPELIFLRSGDQSARAAPPPPRLQRPRAHRTAQPSRVALTEPAPALLPDRRRMARWHATWCAFTRHGGPATTGVSGKAKQRSRVRVPPRPRVATR